MKYPEPIYDHVLVRVDSEKSTTLKRGNLSLEIHGHEYNPDVSVVAQRIGRVVSVPRKMLTRIEPEIRVGDMIHMHYNAIAEESVVEIGKERLFMVPYEMVFAVIDGDNIRMIGGRVLCEPALEDGVTQEGCMAVKKRRSGLITEINVEHDLKRAILSHIGTPLRGAPVLPVVAGDEVWYLKDADFKNVINNKTYFCMTQEDLILYRPKV